MKETQELENRKKFILPIIIVLCYSIYFYFVCYLSYENGWLISKKSLTKGNIIYALISDGLCMQPFVIGLLLFYAKRLEILGIRKSIFATVLFGIYMLLFIIHKDFTLIGIYRAVFYLLFVAIPEEIIYRGYLYLQLKKWSKIGAVIISGIMFGCIHAVLPAILNEINVDEMLINMLSQVGGGICSGLIFIGFYELGGSLLVPILIHALLDYSSWGIPITIVAFVYLYVKKLKTGEHNEIKNNE